MKKTRGSRGTRPELGFMIISIINTAVMILLGSGLLQGIGVCLGVIAVIVFVVAEVRRARISRAPEFGMPQHAPSAPEDLSSLIEEYYEGLSKVIVSKMIRRIVACGNDRRGQYDQVAQIICEDNPSKKTTPLARLALEYPTPEVSADDIADYCMMCMQYDVDRAGEPSTYKVTLVGPPGRGRFERSKHINLRPRPNLPGLESFCRLADGASHEEIVIRVSRGPGGGVR